MTDTIDETGYLETDYLVEEYLGGEIGHHISMQVNQILAPTVPKGMQATNVQHDKLKKAGMQVNAHPANAKHVGMSSKMFVNNFQNHRGMQVQAGVVDVLVRRGMEAKQGKLRSALNETYLEPGYSDGYLTGPYLGESISAYAGMQVAETIRAVDPVGMQAQNTVTGEADLGMQATMVINVEYPIGMQALQITIEVISMQATMVLYNTTQLRIMYTFPSRGTPAQLGINWTASSTASGDYSADNLNTDVIEQVFRSGASSASFVSLSCDTGVVQGVPIDTIAILGHNLTRSALVQVQGSNDSGFSTINISFNMTVETLDMYYIAPTYPTAAGQNRYWRFIFQDPTNPAGFIEIGTILFGSAKIFSITESFTNPVRKRYKHFKDVLNTEGFTNVMNDRAFKKLIRLTFEKLNRFTQNFRILDDMMVNARTDLKVLVIPTPEFPSRFAIFGKVTDLPETSHQSIDITTEYIDVDFEWDESL